MFYNKTDYSRNNCDRNAIVYCDAFGQIMRLTKADFESEEEFTQWKLLSDNDYHESEKEDHLYRDRKISIRAIDGQRIVIPSHEDLMLEFITELERQRLRELLMQGFSEILTDIQRRRLWMYCVDGLDEYEIAGIEGVGQRRISTSITDAKNKLKKFLKKGG